MTRSIRVSDKPAIEYPDCNGEPMSDNTLQFKWIVMIKDGLEAIFRNDPNVFVAGDLLWYAVEGRPLIRTAPDAMVVFGRPKGRRGSYKQWEEDNVAPQVVFEVLSPGNRARDLRRKFAFYDKYGAEEYYVYDPDSGNLEGWLRRAGHLAKVPRMKGFVSPRLNVRFVPGKGSDNLKIIDSEGNRFLTYVELVERAEAEQRRAEAERRRADRLAARLKALGEDAD